MMQNARNDALHAAERGDDDALDRIRLALQQTPHDGALIIAEADVRAASGDSDACSRLKDILRRAPDWADGHAAMARILWETGSRDNFSDELERALALRPQDGNLWNQYIELFAGTGQPEKAANAAREAQAQGFTDPILLLIEAIHAGTAGDHDRAAKLFDALPADMAARFEHEARHAMRLGQHEKAAALLDTARANEPGDVGVWALTEICWRLLGDSRHDWLICDGAVIQKVDLGIEDDALDGLTDLLRSLHNAHSQPIGQSVRNGTQTRGNIAKRGEPPLQELFRQFELAIGEYLGALPPSDPTHPLLAHREQTMQVHGAWSVRLEASGFHTSHIHPAGKISSAFYAAVPDVGGDERAGFLELGRPPADIDIDLGPLAHIEPVAGGLALFPSYLYHGTVPFTGDGDRVVVAFDAA